MKSAHSAHVQENLESLWDGEAVSWAWPSAQRPKIRLLRDWRTYCSYIFLLCNERNGVEFGVHKQNLACTNWNCSNKLNKLVQNFVHWQCIWFLYVWFDFYMPVYEIYIYMILYMHVYLESERERESCGCITFLWFHGKVAHGSRRISSKVASGCTG